MDYTDKTLNNSLGDVEDNTRKYKGKKRGRKPTGRTSKMMRVPFNLEDAVRRILDEAKKSKLKSPEENMLLFDIANRVKQLVAAEPTLREYVSLAEWVAPILGKEKWLQRGIQAVPLRDGSVDLIVQRNNLRPVLYYGSDFAWNEFIELVKLRAKYAKMAIPAIAYQDVWAEWNGNKIVEVSDKSEELGEAEEVALPEPEPAPVAEEAQPSSQPAEKVRLFEFSHRRSQLVKLLPPKLKGVHYTCIASWQSQKIWAKQKNALGAVLHVQRINHNDFLYWGDDKAWAAYIAFVKATFARYGISDFPAVEYQDIFAEWDGTSVRPLSPIHTATATPTERLELEQAIALLRSADPFPVDLDAAHQWLGYTSRHNASEFLRSLPFAEGRDFEIRKIKIVSKTGRKYVLTVSCFKQLAQACCLNKARQTEEVLSEAERYLASQPKVVVQPEIDLWGTTEEQPVSKSPATEPVPQVETVPAEVVVDVPWDEEPAAKPASAEVVADDLWGKAPAETVSAEPVTSPIDLQDIWKKAIACVQLSGTQAFFSDCGKLVAISGTQVRIEMRHPMLKLAKRLLLQIEKAFELALGYKVQVKLEQAESASAQKPAQEPQPEPPLPVEEESDMVESNSLALLEDIRSEFQIDKDGKAFASRRAIARLAGVSDMAIRKLLASLAGENLRGARTLEPIAGQGFDGFEGANLIPDTVVACIIGYYALDAGRYCTDQARRVCAAFSAIGFRTWVQHELGWQPAQVPSNPGSRGDILREMAAMADEVDLVKSQQAEIARRHAQLEQIVTEWMAKQQAAGQSATRRDPKLAHLPLSNQPIPEQTLRSQIVECMDFYVTLVSEGEQQSKGEHYQAAWNVVYSKLKSLYKYHVRARLRHNPNGDSLKPLDQIEQDRQLVNTHCIITEMIQQLMASRSGAS